jgi:GH15 family glucan-1,4-alpha-glucosidase
MAWVAFDRAIKSAERFGLNGPIAHWRRIAETIRNDVLTQGFNASRGAFVQYYGSEQLDASLLLLPLVGFLHSDDPRMQKTVRAIERELMENGLVRRYLSASGIDGTTDEEGAFLPCTLWLADNYVLAGRRDDAIRMLDRVLSLRNDVGLLSEEYDPRGGQFLGNFPQAFSHVALVNTIHNLTLANKPGTQRFRDRVTA